MAVAVMIAMGLLALGAVAAWVMAIGTARRLPNPAGATSARARNLAGIVRAAFSPTPEDKADPALQKKLRLQVQISLACLLAMAIVSFALPLFAEQKTPVAISDGPIIVEWQHEPGTTLSYIRSNQNGSKPERILVHVVAPDELHVVKMIAPCTDAAYVTAKFYRPGHAVSLLVGGRLQRDLTQLPQVWLQAKPGELVLRVDGPAAQPVETHPVPTQPWRMYDFDFAEFAFHGPRAKADFVFGLAMAIPNSAPPLLQILGEAKAKFLYSSDNGAKNHFRLSGPAFTDPLVGDRGGEIITDAKYGHIVEARLGRPNHPGYDNFMLKLIEATPPASGPKAWRDALTAHWSNCPPADAEK